MISVYINLLNVLKSQFSFYKLASYLIEIWDLHIKFTVLFLMVHVPPNPVIIVFISGYINSLLVIQRFTNGMKMIH